MKGNFAMFIGHSTCSGINVSVLESVIEDLILEGTDNFLCGGMGSFDHLCTGVLHRLSI